jgi:hypothetical protein
LKTEVALWQARDEPAMVVLKELITQLMTAIGELDCVFRVIVTGDFTKA